MNALTLATNNLSKAINTTMPDGGYLTLEVGVSLDGIKTITASIASGASKAKSIYYSITGVITNGYHNITDTYNMSGFTESVINAFRELMFSMNTMLSNQELTSVIYSNGMTAFNAVIKPWSIEITHLEGYELVHAARMRDCDNMVMSGVDGSDLGGFKIGHAKNDIQKAYELLSDKLLMSEPNAYL